MIQIIPAILEPTFKGVLEKLEKLEGRVTTIQIDVCDGVFVPSVSWPYSMPVVTPEAKYYDEFFKKLIAGNGEVDMPRWEHYNFELDLMIANPKALLPDLLTIGPSSIIFHAESFTDLYSDMHEITKTIPPIIEVGVSIDINTNPEVVFKLVDEKLIQFVQCMGIAKDGFQGQPLDDGVYKNLKILREKYPNLILSVDGSVNLGDAKNLVEAGATQLVVGSAIFSQKNPVESIAEFERVVQ